MGGEDVDSGSDLSNPSLVRLSENIKKCVILRNL